MSRRALRSVNAALGWVTLWCVVLTSVLLWPLLNVATSSPATPSPPPAPTSPPLPSALETPPPAPSPKTPSSPSSPNSWTVAWPSRSSSSSPSSSPAWAPPAWAGTSSSRAPAGKHSPRGLSPPLSPSGTPSWWSACCRGTGRCSWATGHSPGSASLAPW